MLRGFSSGKVGIRRLKANVWTEAKWLTRTTTTMEKREAEATEEEETGDKVAKRAKTSTNNNNNEKFRSTRSDREKAAKIEQAFSDAFGPLNLEELVKGHGKTRPRNHVNPLAARFQVPVTPPAWDSVYEDCSKPLWVDVGCGQGRFGFQMALHDDWGKTHNHLGLEIREPHVARANVWVKEKGLKNLHYIFCNANTSLEGLLQSYPGPVGYVAVQFPDPQFKRKYHKRRVVNTSFLDMLGKNLKSGTKLFFQSDVEEAAAQMRDRTHACKYFDRIGEYSPRDAALDPKVCAEGSDDSVWTRDGKRPVEEGKEDSPQDYGDWLLGSNPIGVRTEREVQNEDALALPVYRCMFVRNEVEYSSSN